MSRLGLRLDDAGHAELVRRLDDVLQEFAARPPDPGGRPWSVFVAVPGTVADGRRVFL